MFSTKTSRLRTATTPAPSPALGSARTRAVIDQKERDQMLAFAIRWLPFGGGPREDIFVEFGIPDHEFYARLTTELENDIDDVRTVHRRELLKLCREKSGWTTRRSA